MNRSRAMLLLRVTVSLGMLAFLVPHVHLRSLVPRWRPSVALWLIAALLVTVAGIIVSALRWQRVLAAMGIRARTTTLVSHYLAGLFVSNFLPSTIGGDVLRVSRLSADTGERPATFASVVLERLTGWLVLPLITLTGLAINPGLLRLGAASRVAVALATGTLLLLTGILAVTASSRLGGRLAGHASWLRFIGAVHLGLDRFRQRPATAVSVLVVGLAYQLLVVLAAFFAARALGLDIGPTAILAFMPAVAIAQVLPISVGGLGIREGAFALFLHPLGVETAQAVALGVLVYALNLVASLLGAPAFAVGGRRRAATSPQALV